MADGLASSTKKAMDIAKEELSEEESKSLTALLEKVEEACKSDNKEDIDKAVEDSSKIAQPLSGCYLKKRTGSSTNKYR